MRHLPSKKIVWFVVGIVAVEGFLVFSDKQDELFKKEASTRPELAAEEAAKTPIFFRDPNTSRKTIAEVTPTDNVFNYLNEVGRQLAEGSQTIAVPQVELVVPEPNYTSADLTIVPTNNDAVRVYAFSVLTILESGATDIEEDAFTVISHFLETNETDDLDMLSAIQKIERVKSEALAQIAVPEAFVSVHMELINSIHAASKALGDIATTRTNPQAGFLAAATYANFKSKQAQAVVNLTRNYNKYASLTSRDTTHDSE